jgi:hypothetical protein
MTPPPSPEHPKDWYFLSCLVLLPISAFLVFGIPHLSDYGYPMKFARAGHANALLSQLEQATKAYELDFGAFPQGDGSGTAELMRCLARSGKLRCAYFEYPRECLSPGGDLPSPVDPDKIVHYRCPGLHRPASFDLWCEDAGGRPDGVNNWGK